MGLRVKLLLCLLCLMLISLASLGGGIYWFFIERTQERTLHYQQQIVQPLIDQSRRDLSSLSRSLQELSLSPVLQEAVGQLDTPLSLHNLQELQIVLANWQGLHRDVRQLKFYDQQGRYVAHMPRTDRPPLGLLRFDADNPDYSFDGLVARRFVRNQGRFGVEWVVPVSGANGEPLGVLVAEADLRSLESLLLASDTVNTKLFFSNTYGDLLVKSQGLGFNHLPVTSLRGEPATGANMASPDSATMVINQVEYVFTVKPVLPGLWLGVMVDVGNITEVAVDLIHFLVPMMAAIFVLVGAVFYWNVNRLIIAPVDALIRATRHVASGNFSPRLELHSSDELGQLGKAFSEMGSKLQSSSQQIQQLAYFDPLTRLPNRATLKGSLNTMLELARRRQVRLAVLFIDLDDFKKINDRLGHDVGDQLLVQVSERITQALRLGDLVADVGNPESHLISRRGGDEFNAVLFDVQGPREAAVVAERLLEDINQPMHIEGSPVSVGASIGIAMFPEDGADADTLLRNADLAMYEAKAMGKNKFYLYTAALNAQVHERLELEQGIIRGLQRDEFELRYQPKVRLDTMEVVGFEALIRWLSPERGVVSPTTFVPLSEESQLIHKLGQWVLIEVMRQIRQWDSQLPSHMRIALNISARQLAEEAFAERLFAIARQFGVPLSRLEVELTETSIMVDEVLVRQHLYALRTMGVRISLDDFGTGYSSLTFLRNLPIDAVKIDRSFIMRLQDSDESRAIVRSVLELCAKLSLETIAEGVETQEQMNLLIKYGCHEGQGYLFARPLGVESVVSFAQAPVYGLLTNSEVG